MRKALTAACSIVWLLAMPVPAMAQDSNSGTPQAPPTPSPTPTPSPMPTPAAPPTPSAAAPENYEQSDAICRAQWKAYLKSLACFAPYRHSAHVIDVEAFKHCKVVKEPDCPRP